MSRSLLTLLAIWLLSRTAGAQDPHRLELPPEEWRAFAELDLNHDGVVTRDEARAQPELARYFDDVDRNHDGVISYEEYRTFVISPFTSGPMQK